MKKPYQRTVTDLTAGTFRLDLHRAPAYAAPRMRPRITSLLPILVLAGCTRTVDHSTPDADPDHPYAPPRTDLVPAIGSESTLEIATWNIQNFPARPSTPQSVADVIASLDVDVIVTEEIADESAWDELLLRLRDYDGILSTHQYAPGDYQKIGVIYRRSLVTPGDPTLLFTGDGYDFPRPPLDLPITVDGHTIELIGIHLKAGTTDDDRVRRQGAVVSLEARLRAQIDGGGQAEVVVLGDYNQEIVADVDRAILAPLLDAPDRYTVRTDAGATAGGVTYLGFGGEWIDHVTTTAALDARWTDAQVVVPDLPGAILGYRDFVSDHLPVVLIAPR